MKIKVSEAQGAVLDWLVAKCEGEEVKMVRGQLETLWTDDGWKPSTNWALGGPILEREHLQPSFQEHGKYKGLWACNKWVKDRSGATVAISQYGPTTLIAGMRCRVASKLGEEVEVPDELIGEMV